MRFMPLVWAMLWRSRARTWLTFLSIAIAFVLFALLRTVESGFFQGVRLAGDDRLMVTYRQGLTQVLPYAYLSQIETVDGVRTVTPVFPFGGTYQDAKQQVQGAAVDPMRIAGINPTITLPPEQLKAFQTVRAGALVGRELAQRYGWKLGDRIPLILPVHRKDGTQHWEFEVVGIFQYDEKQIGYEVPANFMLVRYDYWNESVQFANHVPWYTVRVDDPRRAVEVGRAIDRLFANSRFETRTQLERDFQAAFLRQIGDVGAIFAAILAAVFFTLILVSGNAMMQAFRERIPELGVLKTLGFGNARLAALIVGEALLLCVAAGLVGLGIAVLAAEALLQVQVQGLQIPGVGTDTVLAGVWLAAGLGLLAALIPAWKSARLNVTDALAEQS